MSFLISVNKEGMSVSCDSFCHPMKPHHDSFWLMSRGFWWKIQNFRFLGRNWHFWLTAIRVAGHTTRSAGVASTVKVSWQTLIDYSIFFSLCMCVYVDCPLLLTYFFLFHVLSYHGLYLPTKIWPFFIRPWWPWFTWLLCIGLLISWLYFALNSGHSLLRAK